MTRNDEDPIIDSLLEETLGGVSPPDLSARILHRWSEHHHSISGNGAPPLNVFADVAEPLPPPIVVGAVRTAYEPSAPSMTRRRRKDWSQLQLWSSLGAAAAVLLVGYIGVQLSGHSNQIAQPG